MKHEELINKMTLEEKVALLSGKGEWQTWNLDRLEIPSIYCSDGPHEIRKQAGIGDHIKGVQAGSDLEMPNPGLDSARQIIAAVKEGRLLEETVNTNVDRMLDAILTLSENRKKLGAEDKFDEKAHHIPLYLAPFVLFLNSLLL